MKRTIFGFLVLLLTAYCSLLTAFAQGTPGTVRYPSDIDTLDSLFGRLTDGPQTTLSGTISSGETTITVVASGTAAFGSSGSGKLDNEIFYYTSKTSNQFLGVIRGRDGTTATNHITGAKVSSPILSVHHRTLANALIAVETDLASIDHSIGSGDVIAALGYTPMRGSNNLSEILTPSTARSNLGLGSIATQSAGSVTITGGNISNVTCIACVGSVSGTGGVDNPDTTVIGAANQSLGDTGGFISLKTRQTERFQVGNTGDFGIGGTSTGALFDVFTLPSTGTKTIFNLRTNEAGSGNFTEVYTSTAGSNGETRRDNQRCFGYNLAGDAGVVAGEHSYFNCGEMRYKTAEGTLQLELYEGFTAGSESSLPGSWRFQSTTIGLTNSSIVLGRFADSVTCWDKDGIGDGAGQPYFKMQMDDSVGEFIFTGNSSVRLNSSNDVWLKKGEDPVLTIVSGNDISLGSGGAGSDEHLRLFPSLSLFATSALVSLDFGQWPGGHPIAIRFNGDPAVNDFQYTHTSPGAPNVWRKFNDQKIFDSGTYYPISIGAADSCGTGFRCLKITN
jgi:hypothetical protein